MKIVVITGSPRKKGTSSVLVEQFIKGANEAGHGVYRFDSAFANVSPCKGCNYCKTNESCCIKDDMEELTGELVKADVIVFAMPVYYFGMPAQIKAVVDRIYAPESKMYGNKKVALMATAYNPDVKVMAALVKQYDMIVDYMKWENLEMILASGCGARDDITNTDYPLKAYEFGKSI